MNEQKMKAAWELLKFRVRPHSEQTNRFTRPLSDSRVPGQLVVRGFTQKELVRMSPVMPETLASMRYFLPMIPAKNQPEFRRQLAYLVELRGLQADAWTDAIQLAEKDAERNSNALKNMVYSWE